MINARLTFYCADTDADLIAETLKDAVSRPVHVRTEQVFGLDFSDASAQESVIGQLNRHAVELLVDRTDALSLVERIGRLKRTAPVRWHLTPVEAEGRLP